MTRRWSGLWVLAIALVACLSFTAVGAAPTTFTDPQGRFSFTVPDGYQQQSVTPTTSTSAPSSLIAAFFSPKYNGANVNVGAVSGAPSGISLDQLADQVLKSVSDTFKDFQRGPKGIESTTLGGQPARRYEYFATVSGARFHGVQYLTIAKGSAIFLTFTASDNDFNAFINESKGIVDSFTILGGAAPGATVTTPTATAATPPPTASAPSGTASSSARANFIRRLGDG
jgi:hypothetical protein